jgi:DNA-binding beta-propeller fold protein YncE
VADTGNNRIQELSPAGKSIAQWGTFGAAAGQFSSPTSISVDAHGAVLVADTGNDRVQLLAGPSS